MQFGKYAERLFVMFGMVEKILFAGPEVIIPSSSNSHTQWWLRRAFPQGVLLIVFIIPIHIPLFHAPASLVNTQVIIVDLRYSHPQEVYKADKVLFI